MSSKRGATSDLNHENWDNEEEPEEAGVFKRASDEQLKSRVIRTAKRRIGSSIAQSTPLNDEKDGDDNNEPAPPKSIFSGFSGFGKQATAVNPASTFSFLSKIPAANGSNSLNKSIVSNSLTPAASLPMMTKDKCDNYYSKIKGLNLSVSKWINEHVDKNPLCILTPIFDDYKKHLQEIDENETKNVNNNSTSAVLSTAAPKPTFSFESNASSFNFKPAATSSTISSTGSTVPSTLTPTFSFGSSVSSSKTLLNQTSTLIPTASTGFSFGSNTKPFSFGNVSKPVDTVDGNDNAEAQEEDESPPKNEFVPVVEENVLYTHVIKMYVRNENNYVPRGKGTLYIKSVDNSEKKQLIVRADTNLGNILLNIILSKAIPAKRNGNTNVMLICLPTPDCKPPPTTVLLRSKSAESADELLQAIDKYSI